MKKIVSALVCMAVSAGLFVPVYAADGDMQSALAAVKEKIEIPSELSEFRAGESGTDEKSFVFRWSDADYEQSIRVETDVNGNIGVYARNGNINPDNQKSLPLITRADAKDIAEKFLAKAMPELFADNTDRLVSAEESGNPQPGTSRYNFRYVREKDGVPVWGNTVDVSVEAYKNEAYVSRCIAQWDYAAKFSATAEKMPNPEVNFFKAFPIELRYEKIYGSSASKNPEVRLIYDYADVPGYISAANGEIVEPYIKTGNDGYMSGGSGMAENTAMDKESGFTDEELAELENFKGLISADEVERNIRALPGLGLGSDIKLRNSSVYRRTKGTAEKNERYIMNLYFANEEERRNLSVTADALTGEILSIYNYSFDEKESKSAVDAENFLKAAAPEKISECEPYADNDGKARLRRIINGVPYENNALSVTYDMTSGLIRSFTVEWDDDTDELEPADKVMGIDAAKEKLLEYKPIAEVYVPVENGYALCFGISEAYNTEIYAATGEQVYPTEKDEEVIYSDIVGHWSEKAVSELAAMGFTAKADKFSPDEKITQERLLRLIMNSVWGYDYGDDTEAFYNYAVRRKVVADKEKNPEGEVSRADAFVFMVRVMGYEKIAKLPDIFSCGYSDADLIAKDKLGYAAILSGMNIISGDGENLRANDFITNAEAAVMVYNYMKSNG